MKIKNPSSAHLPPPLHISASAETRKGFLEILPRTEIPTNPLEIPENVPGASAGDAQPLRVENPRLVVKDIQQSTDNPGESNAIKVTILSNYAEFPGRGSLTHSLHIGNLMNFSEPSNEVLQLNFFNPSSLAKQHLHDRANWNRETGELTIKFKGGGYRLAANKDYVMEFILRNGPSARVPRQPTIGLEVGEGEVALPPVAMRVVTTCQDMVAWQDSEGHSCQDYADNAAWCDGLARDQQLVFPPAMYAKSPSGYAQNDPYNNWLLDAADVCCVCRQSGMGIGEVSDPFFLHREITQSMPYPDSDNVITISLKSNVYIPRHSTVILSGLRGSSTASTSMLPLLGPATSNQEYGSLASALEICDASLQETQCLAQGCCKFDEQGPQGAPSKCYADLPAAVCSPFGANALWQQGPGMLTLNVTRPIMAGRVHAMRFQLRNPSQNNTAGPVTINVTISDYQTASASWTKRTVLADSHLHAAEGPIERLPGSQNGDARPLHVLAPAIVLRHIEQSRGFPGVENKLIFSLAFSVELSASSGDRLEIHGLKGAIHPRGRISLLQQGVNATHLVFGADQEPGSEGTGFWKPIDYYQDSAAPSLTLLLHPDRKISAGLVYQFAIEISNPAAAQNSPDIWVVHSGQRYQLAPVLVDKSSADLVNAQQMVVGSKQPLQVLDEGWIWHEAAQSTMYPGEENTITVSLVSSAMLEQGTWITIAGFLGALPHDLQIIPVGTNAVSSSESAVDIGFGEWDGGRKRMVLTLTPGMPLQPGILLLLTFQLRNPSGAQASPQLFVRTSLSIASVTVGANHGCTEDAVLQAGGGGGSDFSAIFRRNSGLVEIENGGKGFLSQPMISVASGGAGCIGNTFTAVLRGTSLATQTIQSNAMAVPAGKLAAVAGHAVPLRVEDKRLHSASVSHTTAWPDAVNRVTLSVIFNFALDTMGQPALVLSNFDGITFVADAQGIIPMHEGKLVLHDAHRLYFGSSPSEHDESTAFVSDIGELFLYVVRPLVPEVEYRVSFFTLNTNTSRAGRNLNVRVAERANARQVEEMMTTTDQQDDCPSQCTTDQIHKASPSETLPNLRAVLAVYASSFYVARIRQNNPYPSAQNSITVAFASNVRLDSSSVLHITGLRGYASATTDVVAVLEESEGGLISVASEARWSREDELLSVPLTRTTVEFQEYRFVVTLTNPAYGQHYTASPVQLSSRGVNIAPTIMQRDTTQVLTSINGISVPGDQAPPQIRQPVLARAIISQTQPYAAAHNTFTLFFESNVDLPAAAAITLSGFSGAQSSASLLLGSIGADADQQGMHADQHLLFEDSDGNAGQATWQASTASVRIYSVSNLAAMTHVALTFTLTNLMVGRAAATIYASSAQIGIRSVLVRGDTEIELCGIPGTARGEASPLAIRSPEITLNSISQSSTFPGDDANVITVNLQFNARISDCTLAIEGLPSSVGNSSGTIPLSSSDGTSSHVFSVGASVSQARMENGLILLYVSPVAEMVPFTTYSFSFTVRNPDFQTQPPPLYISACSLITTPQLMTPLRAPIPGLVGSVPGDAAVLKVDNPAFILKEIVQSTPWPGSTNTLTLSIAANVDLYSKTGDLTTIAVSGLTGTQTNDNDAMVLALDTGSPFSSTGKWARFTGTMEISIKASEMLSAGSIQTVSFDIMNPSAKRNGATIRIEGSFLYLSPAPGSSEMRRQIEETEMDTSSTYIPPVLKAKAGDAAPLLIYSPAFIERVIGQRSAYPGAANTLTMTLTCNVDLQAPATLTLVGLGSLGTSTIALLTHDLFELNSANSDSLVFTFKGLTQWARGQRSEFKIGVINPSDAQDSASALISASSPEELSTSVALESDSTTLLGQLGAVVGDAAPLRVKAPALILASLGQSSSFPKQANTLTLTIASNFDLQQTHIIRLINLGAAAKDPQSTQTTGVLTKLNPWTEDEISLQVNSPVQAGTAFTWTCTIMNPPMPQSAPAVFVRVDETGIATPIIATQRILSHTQEPNEQALFVQDLSFTVSLGQQNMALPHAINEIALTIGTTVSLPVGSLITVSGLTREQTMLAVQPVMQDGLVRVQDDTFGCNHNLYFDAPGQSSDLFPSVLLLFVFGG